MEQRFQLHYDLVGGLLKALGLGPGFAWIAVTRSELVVHMGWAFDLRVPRSQVAGVRPLRALAGFGQMLAGWGIHTNFAGTWYVNGAQTNLVRIDLAEAVRGRMMLIPVRVTRVVVSVQDVDGLIATLR
jgi:hypothetical protein